MNSTPSSHQIAVRIPTTEGEFVARYSEAGLAALNFPGRQSPTPALDDAIPARVRAWHRLVVTALVRAMTGRAPGKLPPLDVSRGTDFQQEVWGAMQAIPTGEARSYGDIARSIGKPGATRAVGSACGANPIPVFIPCHRVLAAGGRIGGFSSDMKWKRTLLDREGVVVKR